WRRTPRRARIDTRAGATTRPSGPSIAASAGARPPPSATPRCTSMTRSSPPRPRRTAPRSRASRTTPARCRPAVPWRGPSSASSSSSSWLSCSSYSSPCV
ncbi:MAG: hypothetical protein AVDCRST_MAG18-941, partial [uncultured Thermomicrobiales bacterium]